MFTLDQISALLANVKTGADFPEFVKGLAALGVIRYTTYVADGHSVYEGADSYEVTSIAKYDPLVIAQKSNPANFTQYLKMHQQGLSDYLTFCQHAATTGVEKWLVEMGAMTCTYYDVEGLKMLAEKIPAA